MEAIFDSARELRNQLDSYLEDVELNEEDPKLVQIVKAIDNLCIELFKKELSKRPESIL